MRRFSFGLGRRGQAVVGSGLAWLLLTGIGLAASHDQSDLRFDRSPLPYLFAVYAVTWLAFFAYAFYITRRQRQLRREIEELRRRLEEKKE